MGGEVGQRQLQRLHHGRLRLDLISFVISGAFRMPVNSGPFVDKWCQEQLAPTGFGPDGTLGARDGALGSTTRDLSGSRKLLFRDSLRMLTMCAAHMEHVLGGDDVRSLARLLRGPP